MAYEGPDKRFIRRHHAGCVSVRFRRKRMLSNSLTGPSARCELSDINWRGMRFYSPRWLRRGSVIEVEFDCPLDVESLDTGAAARARVIWQKWSTRHKAWRTGVQFVGLSDELREAILRMIDSATEHERKFRDGDQEVFL